MGRPSETVASIAGVALLLLGLGVLGETAWFWHTHSVREEPAAPGKTPNLSGTAFHKMLNARTEEERAHWERVDRQEYLDLVEQGRREARWMRIRLYAFAPGGLVLILLGAWLAAARPRDGGR